MDTIPAAEKLGRDGKPLTPISTRWRVVSGGIQLSAGFWWAAYVAPSEINSGQWWWKTAACGESCADVGPSGYAADAQAALTRVREALMADRLYAYTLPADATALGLLALIKH